MLSAIDLISYVFCLYVICNELYFASKGGCVGLAVEGYILTFSLATWLNIDACIRITIISLDCFAQQRAGSSKASIIYDPKAFFGLVHMVLDVRGGPHVLGLLIRAS